MSDKEISAVLHRPFTAGELEWKIQTAGNTNGRTWARIVPYVTARGICDRLNEAFGPFGYSIRTNPIQLGPHAGLKCEILAYLPEASSTGFVSREDVCEITDIEAMKGAASGALKRAAVLFGIGRYLYDAPEFYALIGENLPFRGSYKDKQTNKPVFFKWDLPIEVHQWIATSLGLSIPNLPPQKTRAELGYEDLGKRERSTTPIGPTVEKVVGGMSATLNESGIPKSCPKCGSKVNDYRAKKASGDYKPTSKDWGCSSKDCMDGKYRTGGWVTDKPKDFSDLPEVLAEPGSFDAEFEDIHGQPPLDESQAY